MGCDYYVVSYLIITFNNDDDEIWMEVSRTKHEIHLNPSFMVGEDLESEGMDQHDYENWVFKNWTNKQWENYKSILAFKHRKTTSIFEDGFFIKHKYERLFKTDILCKLIHKKKQFENVVKIKKETFMEERE